MSRVTSRDHAIGVNFEIKNLIDASSSEGCESRNCESLSITQWPPSITQLYLFFGSYSSQEIIRKAFPSIFSHAYFFPSEVSYLHRNKIVTFAFDIMRNTFSASLSATAAPKEDKSIPKIPRGLRALPITSGTSSPREELNALQQDVAAIERRFQDPRWKHTKRVYTGKYCISSCSLPN